MTQDIFSNIHEYVAYLLQSPEAGLQGGRLPRRTRDARQREAGRYVTPSRQKDWWRDRRGTGRARYYPTTKVRHVPRRVLGTVKDQSPISVDTAGAGRPKPRYEELEYGTA